MSRSRRRLPKRTYAQYKPSDTARWETVNHAQLRYLRRCTETNTEPDREAFLFLAEPKAGVA